MKMDHVNRQRYLLNDRSFAKIKSSAKKVQNITNYFRYLFTFLVYEKAFDSEEYLAVFK